jgi:tripartite-type tricarboxylate transporter receptor subunit TctC
LPPTSVITTDVNLPITPKDLLAFQEQKKALLFISASDILSAMKRRRLNPQASLQPITSVAAESWAFISSTGSSLNTIKDVLEKYARKPKSVAFGGVGADGTMDHFVVARTVSVVRPDVWLPRYSGYDSIGKALESLRQGQVDVLAVPLNEMLHGAKEKGFRVLAVTSRDRHPDFSQIQTLRESGYPVDIVNWHGFFTSTESNPKEVEAYRYALKASQLTKVWEFFVKGQTWNDFVWPTETFKEVVRSDIAFMEKFIKYTQ